LKLRRARRSDKAKEPPTRPPGPAGERGWSLVQRFCAGLDMGIVVVVRATDVVVWSSEIANQQLGYPSDELPGRGLASLYADRLELEALRRQADSAFDGIGHLRAEIAMRRSDGSTFDTEQSLHAMDDPSRFLIAIRDVSQRRESERALAQSRDELRRLSQRLQSSLEEERARIARGLQEDLGQELTALTLDLKLLRERNGEEHRATLDRMIDSIKGTLDRVQEVCANLRPAILDHLGLVATIEWAAADFERRTGIRCAADLDPSLELLVDPYAIALLRIVQEALLNVRQHAAAKRVRIFLSRDSERRVVLSVADDGLGISRQVLDSPESLGLLSIRERARSLGGRAEIRSGARGGTTVDVRLPPHDLLPSHVMDARGGSR
jgi:PAS domain S-box-containing protein